MAGLSREEKIALWAQLETDIAWVLQRVTMSDEDRAFAVEYNDNREYGLAWDIIDHAVADTSPEVATMMEGLRQRMGITRRSS